MAHQSWKRVCAGVMAMAAVLVSAPVASRADMGDTEQPGRDDLRALSAQWWQLVNSIPPGDNPTFDTNGAKCMVGQRGPIWFLMGTSSFGPGPNATRACDVPQGTPFFFPLSNSIFFNTPNVCGQGAAVDAKGARAMATAGLGTVSAISVMLDGKPVSGIVTRIKSDIFAVWLPGDNIYNAACEGAGLGTVPAGIYSPSADDGFYAFLPPLDVGPHLLVFSATTTTATAITSTITYELNVVPVILH